MVGGNCLGFVQYHTAASQQQVSCIEMFNNSCASVSPYYGLVGVGKNLTITDSVFQGNTADYFCGGPGNLATLTLVRCVLDDAAGSGAAISGGSISKSNCGTTNDRTWLPTCETTTRSPARTQTPLMTRSAPSQTSAPTAEFTEAWDSVMAPRILVRMSYFVVLWNWD
jgi:hypothetical protein